jgi:hypothetical protein
LTLESDDPGSPPEVQEEVPPSLSSYLFVTSYLW